jgi:hypothetical protein
MPASDCFEVLRSAVDLDQLLSRCRANPLERCSCLIRRAIRLLFGALTDDEIS